MDNAYLFQNICLMYLGGPCLVENELEGALLKNCVELEVIGAKDCLNMIEAAMGKTSFLEEESSTSGSTTLLIQFEVYEIPLNYYFSSVKSCSCYISQAFYICRCLSHSLILFKNIPLTQLF